MTERFEAVEARLRAADLRAAYAAGQQAAAQEIKAVVEAARFVIAATQAGDFNNAEAEAYGFSDLDAALARLPGWLERYDT